MLQAFPQADELGEAVVALPAEPFMPLRGVAANPSIATKTPTEHRAPLSGASKTRRLKMPDAWEIVAVKIFMGSQL